MGRVARVLGGGLIVLGGAAAALWAFGPYEPADLSAQFEPRRFGEGVGVYFETVESYHDDIIPGTEKRVIWAGERETRTPVSVVYLHGFSASSEEIRPVPDMVAQALGANLVYTRLEGHGRTGEALGEATVNGWMQDVAEALATGAFVGDKVVVISNSTGGTLATAAALDPELSKDMDALVLASPNYGINNPLAPLLTWPAARYWLPVLAGEERSFEPRSEGQARYWTTAYPSVAVMPVAAAVKAVRDLDVSKAEIPALFWYSEADKVVRPGETAKVAAAWGGPVTVHKAKLGPGDDPGAHVLAGDIMSPGQTGLMAAGILDWLKSAGIE